MPLRTISVARLAFLALLAACAGIRLQVDAPIDCSSCEEWMAPQEPFRIHGNTYFVGTAGLSSILIDTGAGLILLDGGLPQSAVAIDRNIRKLGFATKDVKQILVSHVHYDHVGGIAALQKFSDATVVTSASGAIALSRGRLNEDDPQFSETNPHTEFPASANVQSIADGEYVSVGDLLVTGIHTPGHTPGGTSWTWQSCENGACRNIVYADSLSAISSDAFQFSSTQAGIEITTSARKIAALDCDIFLSPHPFFFAMEEKLRTDAAGNPFEDDTACASYAIKALANLERRMRKEDRSRD